MGSGSGAMASHQPAPMFGSVANHWETWGARVAGRGVVPPAPGTLPRFNLAVVMRTAWFFSASVREIRGCRLRRSFDQLLERVATKRLLSDSFFAVPVQGIFMPN